MEKRWWKGGGWHSVSVRQAMPVVLSRFAGQIGPTRPVQGESEYTLWSEFPMSALDFCFGFLALDFWLWILANVQPSKNSFLRVEINWSNYFAGFLTQIPESLFWLMDQQYKDTWFGLMLILFQIKLKLLSESEIKQSNYFSPIWLWAKKRLRKILF